MINRAAAPSFISSLLEQMKLHPFSLSTDGSNDSGLEKMDPITVRIYDVETSEIRTKFLDMCSTAETLFNAMYHKLATLLDEPNPWLRWDWITLPLT